MKKITMIDQLTVYARNGEYKIEIDEKFTKINSLEDIEELENPSKMYFDVLMIGKDGNKIFLAYEVPTEYKSFIKIKGYDKLFKLHLLQNLLEMNPLLESDNKTYLDLNNIFFKDVHNIKLLYRSNGKLPYDNKNSTLEQYKYLIFGLISEKVSYNSK